MYTYILLASAVATLSALTASDTVYAVVSEFTSDTVLSVSSVLLSVLPLSVLPLSTLLSLLASSEPLLPGSLISSDVLASLYTIAYVENLSVSNLTEPVTLSNVVLITCAVLEPSLFL